MKYFHTDMDTFLIFFFSNPNVPSESANNGENANGKEKEESAEEGQTLKESANDNDEATQQQFSPKAIPIPPSVTEESSIAPQFHPKQLAPAGNPQEESRQYGAKTIVGFSFYKKLMVFICQFT
jgi:hypothetical protein